MLKRLVYFRLIQQRTHKDGFTHYINEWEDGSRLFKGFAADAYLWLGRLSFKTILSRWLGWVYNFMIKYRFHDFIAYTVTKNDVTVT